MLQRLHISNYALIDEVDIDFAPGFNAVTGETGAGKSIMLGALNLILGGRADLRKVPGQGRKSVIEAEFEVNDGLDGEMAALLEANDIDNTASAGEHISLILRRELTPGGRSRAFVNDSPVALAVMQKVAARLVDIHSQQENQLLATAAFQLRVIDSMASNAALRQEYTRAYTALRRAVKRLKTARDRAANLSAEHARMRADLEELSALSLQPGEQAELEAELTRLENVQVYKGKLALALEALSAEERGSLELLDAAVGALDDLATDMPEQFMKLHDRLESAIIELRDITDSLADADASLFDDPRRHDIVSERLSTIYALQRQHGVADDASLIAIAEKLADELNEFDNADSLIASLREEARTAKADTLRAAEALSESRRKAAAEFAERLRLTASPLGMPNLVVDIRVEPTEPGPTGADSVEFLFAFNKNQQPGPVAGAASGGEVSRLMLSIKSLIAGKMQLPSIIFDEVDTGVSGSIAAQMGAMMARMAREADDGRGMQVIAITHLPQVASRAGAHFKVYKADSDCATHTRVNRLNPGERVDELALMLSGSTTLESARLTAQALLNNNPD